MSDIPITLTEPCYGLFDTKRGAFLTTQHGNLAIFTVKSMAEIWARKGGPDIIVKTLRVLKVSAVPDVPHRFTQ